MRRSLYAYNYTKPKSLSHTSHFKPSSLHERDIMILLLIEIIDYHNSQTIIIIYQFSGIVGILVKCRLCVFMDDVITMIRLQEN